MACTHTYAVLAVDAATYEDIQQRLLTCGYGHVFHEDPEHGTVIDMAGIALAKEDNVTNEQPR
jgi:hypothetical protein